MLLRRYALVDVAFKVVGEDAYKKWLDDAKKNFASNIPSATPTFASATTQRRLRLAGND